MPCSEYLYSPMHTLTEGGQHNIVPCKELFHTQPWEGKQLLQQPNSPLLSTTKIWRQRSAFALHNSNNFICKAKSLYKKLATANRTNWISCSIPAQFNFLTIHPSILEVLLCTRGLQSRSVSLSGSKGAPRYFTGRVPSLKPPKREYLVNLILSKPYSENLSFARNKIESCHRS